MSIGYAILIKNRMHHRFSVLRRILFMDVHSLMNGQLTIKRAAGA